MPRGGEGIRRLILMRIEMLVVAAGVVGTTTDREHRVFRLPYGTPDRYDTDQYTGNAQRWVEIILDAYKSDAIWSGVLRVVIIRLHDLADMSNLKAGELGKPQLNRRPFTATDGESGEDCPEHDMTVAVTPVGTVSRRVP